MDGFGKVDAAVIAELKSLVGEKNMITDREKMIDYSHDEKSQEDIRHYPDVVVKPGTGDEARVFGGHGADYRRDMTRRASRRRSPRDASG